MEKVLFKEEQGFRQLWVWLIMLVSFGLPIVLVLAEIVEQGTQSDDTRTLYIVLVVLVVLALPFVGLFLKMKLTVEINENGLRFKFPPLKNKWNVIEKQEIVQYEVRQYKPISEYGGWGIKGNKKNRAYNVNGNIGLQLELCNGRKVLLGTQKKQAIEHAMNKLMNKETNK
jgi:uncharacterized membrane protein